MSYSKLSFQDSLNVIKSVRPRANPSWYFKKQLINFEKSNLPNLCSLKTSNLRQSNEDYTKIHIENLIIDNNSNNVKQKDVAKDEINKDIDEEDKVDLINQIFQVTTHILENGIDLEG